MKPLDWLSDLLADFAHVLRRRASKKRRLKAARKMARTPMLPAMPKPPRGWKPGDSVVSVRELDAARAIRASIEAQAANAGVHQSIPHVSNEPVAVAPRSFRERVTAVVEAGRLAAVGPFVRKKRDSRLPPPMPRRMPIMPVAPRSFTRGELLTRSVMIMASVVIFGFLGNLLVLGHLQHEVAQQQLSNEFREQLALATAPVSEGDQNLVLLKNGAPVAIIDIPTLGVHQVVVEGTDSATLKAGPGHRRDTVLPGQAGISVIMARAAAYGGPFGSIQSLQPGQELSVITGQGYHVYSVIGVRYAGDPGPAEPAEGIGRLVLETARGGPFTPSGVLRVDAQLVSTSKTAPGMPTKATPAPTVNLTALSSGTPSPTPGATGTAMATPSATGTPATTSTPTLTPTPTASATPFAAGATPGATATPGPTTDPRSPTITLASVQALAPGARFTGTNTLPLAERELATDTTMVWALVFGLQLLILVELAAIWAFRRVGLQKTWIVFLPIATLAGLFVSDQLVRLLPNLL
jgi:sortase A